MGFEPVRSSFSSDQASERWPPNASRARRLARPFRWARRRQRKSNANNSINSFSTSTTVRYIVAPPSAAPPSSARGAPARKPAAETNYAQDGSLDGCRCWRVRSSRVQSAKISLLGRLKSKPALDSRTGGQGGGGGLLEMQTAFTGLKLNQTKQPAQTKPAVYLLLLLPKKNST